MTDKKTQKSTHHTYNLVSTTDVELNQNLGKNGTELVGSDESLPKAVSRFRSALPQVLATTAKNLILLDLGMTIAFPTIVIPTLQDGKDPDGLTFNTAQASWFGSIAFICQPLGSVLSGIVLEPLGRKRSMLLVNVPHLIGWMLFYHAQSTTVLYITCALMGLGVGFMEAPIITYVGEISEPSLRGILTSYSGIFVSVGFLFEYTLGNFVDWRNAALISAMVPIITLIAISQVPETPTWLLSKGRNEEAKKSLQWLRGWVPVSLIMEEFEQLKRYNEATRYHNQTRNKGVLPPPEMNGKPRPVSYANEVSIDDELTKPDLRTNGNAYLVNGSATPAGTDVDRKLTFKEKLNDLVRPEMVRPLGLVVVFFFIFYSCGPPAMRPYMVKLFDKMNLPITGKRVTVVMGLVGILGNIFCMICVKWCGKRPLALISTAGSAASIIVLGFCALDASNATSVATAATVKWTPFVLFCSLWFFSNFGLSQIPWMLTSEVFPNRGRGLASGIAAACSYLMAFVASKTYPDLERYLSIHGVCFLYGTLTILGYVFVYFCLPETEGQSLAEIESIYSVKPKITTKKKTASS